MKKTCRLILALAVPAAVMHLAHPLMGVVDTVLMGRSSSLELAALSLGSSFFALLLNPLNAMRMSLIGLVSNAAGKRDFSAANRLVTQGLFLSGMGGLVLMPCFYGLAQLYAELLDLSPKLNQAFQVYLSLRLLGLPLALCDMAMTGYLMGRGKVRLCMRMATGVNLLNAGLSMFLVLSLGMGITGVAIGTLLAQLILLIWQLRSLFSQADFRLDFSLSGLRQLLGLQRDIFLRSMALAIVLHGLPALAESEGIVALALNAILLQLLTLVAYAEDGLASAAEVLAGRAYGRGDSRALARLIPALFLMGMSIAVVAGGVFYGGLKTWLPWLNSSEKVFSAAISMKWVVFWIPLVSTPAWLLDGVFTGMTRTRIMRNSMLTLALFYYGLIAFLIADLNLEGLWSLLLCFMAARGIWLGVSLRKILGGMP